MGFAVAVTFAFCTWVVLYSVGLKSFDGFLLALIIIVTAAGARILSRKFSEDRPLG